jgi:preprotein translocase subunit SecA
MTVIPFEQREGCEDIAQFFMNIAQGKRPNGIKGITITKDENIYVKKDMIINVGVEIGRNDPCKCGSGKKYKKCCGK